MSYAKLESEVIRVGLCTDCGNCAAVCPDKCLAMNYETELPQLVHECSPNCELCYESCPGKDIPMPDLDQMVFGRQRVHAHEELLGINQGFIKCYGADPAVRDKGAGGGFVSALLLYALENKLIDGAVVVDMNQELPWRTEPKIATSREEVMATTSTKENLVPVNAILREAVERGFKKLGVVGLPCHVHAIRKMQLYGRPKEIFEPIKFVIGLVCGANYSYLNTEHLIEDICKVPLTQVAKVEFRTGDYPGEFRITPKSGKVITRRHAGGMVADRCVMCYDYVNDLADVSVGDYWGFEMKRGVPGLSAAIIRTEPGKKLVADAEKAGYVRTEPIKVDNFYMGNFERKKHGGVRTTLKRKEYGWQIPNFHMPLEYPKPMPRQVNLEHPLLS